MSASDGKQEKTKADSTYYFFKSTPAEIAKNYVPKKITADGQVPTQTARAPVTQRMGSTWNTMGTWEEKDYSKWGCSRIKELLKEVKCPAFSNGSLSVSEVTTVEGDATVLFLKGRKRYGFDYKIKLKWKGKVGSKSVSGELRVLNFESDEWPDDCDIEVSGKERDAAHAEATGYMKAVRSDILKALEVFVQEFKKK